MKTIAAVAALALLSTGMAYAAGPANPADRYDYNMRTTNKDGYVPDPNRISNKDGYTPDANRVTNKDGYIPDTAKNDKFDPFTQGARQNTASALVDDKAAKPAKKKSSAHKKAPADATK
ncbi:hypothetical protein [Cupriavidus plantarum]|uniref:hypothetical protein n=1 Tax=Cupriavidus plantarum TaxID=942865 RepID=UPI000EAD97A3|nr:hypothetical protein [Cupriavidus plantarum]RLK39032.1 hypothetical protein C7417_2562 [Cupriavidus plantarum]